MNKKQARSDEQEGKKEKHEVRLWYHRCPSPYSEVQFRSCAVIHAPTAVSFLSQREQAPRPLMAGFLVEGRDREGEDIPARFPHANEPECSKANVYSTVLYQAVYDDGLQLAPRDGLHETKSKWAHDDVAQPGRRGYRGRHARQAALTEEGPDVVRGKYERHFSPVTIDLVEK